MKGYIYIAGRGADPALHDDLNDPLFGPVPTLGACMPNVRRVVEKGDHVFVVSGKTAGVQQYVVGGFRVEEKISALAAYGRFPENRMRVDAQGRIQGNIIVEEDGSRCALDEHDRASFEARARNYLVGTAPLAMTTPVEIERSRRETMNRLGQIVGRPPANRIIDVIGRCKRLDEDQVGEIVAWLAGMKEEPA